MGENNPPKEENNIPKEENNIPKEKNNIPKEKNNIPKEENNPPKEKNNIPKEEKVSLNDSNGDKTISSLKILLAEDNLVNQKVALLTLKKLGYQADVAINGLKVIEALSIKDYDLILMDIQMPEMDGLEACISIRNNFPPHKQPYIIAVTANVLENDRQMCLNAGMNDYIPKPISLSLFREKILQLEQRLNK